MPFEDDHDKYLNDDYVAGLLIDEANADRSIRLSAMGRPGNDPGAKPPTKARANTRFLRQIIKETTAHNAALLAKDATDLRARLSTVGDNNTKPPKSLSRWDVKPDKMRRRRMVEALMDEGPGRKRRRSAYEDDHERCLSKPLHRKDMPGYEEARSQHRQSHSLRRSDRGRAKDKDREHNYSRSRYPDNIDHTRKYRDQSPAQFINDQERLPESFYEDLHRRARKRSRARKASEKDRHRSGKDRHHSDRDRHHSEKHHRSSRRGRSSERGDRGSSKHQGGSGWDRSRSPKVDRSKHHRPRHHGRQTTLSPESSPSNQRTADDEANHHMKKRTNAVVNTESTNKNKATTANPAEDAASDSDPLGEMIGPLLAGSKPRILPRGRGAVACGASSMDKRFSAGYDPSDDIDSEFMDADKGDWDQRVELYQARARWKQLRADRYRTANFSEEIIQAMENSSRTKERTVDDVKWRKEGESREWDRGKVIDPDGEVTTKPIWGRQGALGGPSAT